MEYLDITAGRPCFSLSEDRAGFSPVNGQRADEIFPHHGSVFAGFTRTRDYELVYYTPGGVCKSFFHFSEKIFKLPFDFSLVKTGHTCRVRRACCQKGDGKPMVPFPLLQSLIPPCLGLRILQAKRYPAIGKMRRYA